RDPGYAAVVSKAPSRKDPLVTTVSRTTSTATADGDGYVKATRRRRGEPRRLLLESARELFSRQGYASTSTREIADHAGVSETLMFRYFRSKAGLFREALVEIGRAHV